MLDLQKHEFTCPSCQQQMVTFIPKDKYLSIICRTVDIKTLLPEDKFSTVYRYFFMTSLCSVCQSNAKETFKEQVYTYDIPEGYDTAEIEANISEMWES